MNFFPETIGCGKYAGELAFSLAKVGHQAEVVTAPPHRRADAPYKALRYRRETVDGVNILRCPILMKLNGGRSWRALAPLSFAVFAAPAVIWHIRGALR